MAQMVKNLPAMQAIWVLSQGWENALEKGTHSTILAWRIPWTEEPGGLQSVGPQRVGHDWATNTFTFWPQRTGSEVFGPIPQRRKLRLGQVLWKQWALRLQLWSGGGGGGDSLGRSSLLVQLLPSPPSPVSPVLWRKISVVPVGGARLPATSVFLIPAPLT